MSQSKINDFKITPENEDSTTFYDQTSKSKQTKIKKPIQKQCPIIIRVFYTTFQKRGKRYKNLL